MSKKSPNSPWSSGLHPNLVDFGAGITTPNAFFYIILGGSTPKTQIFANFGVNGREGECFRILSIFLRKTLYSRENTAFSKKTFKVFFSLPSLAQTPSRKTQFQYFRETRHFLLAHHPLGGKSTPWTKKNQKKTLKSTETCENYVQFSIVMYRVSEYHFSLFTPS